MRITIFGLAITSSWGNGHATTFRALCEALHARGHSIVFYEKNVEWYSSNRDMPEPPFCEVRLYEDWSDVLPQVRRSLRESDVAIVGSYFPDGIAALDELAQSEVPVRAFYDIDTPITLAQLRQGGRTDYLRDDQIRSLDLYFSFTGGPALGELENVYGAPRAVPLYCSVDSNKYKRTAPNPRFACDLSYMGTYAPDRQPKIEELMFQPALRLPEYKFLVAGPMYPEDMYWPNNVEHIPHLEPKYHSQLYSSSRLVLNVTRRDMVMAGYSPSVRLFEAAACAATIVSDNWPGLSDFFTAGKEILLPATSDDVLRYLAEFTESELRAIGEAAQQRILTEHTNDHRAAEFEKHVSSVVQSVALRSAV